MCHGSNADTASPPPAPSLLPGLQLREVLKSGGPTALMTRLYRDYLQVGAQSCNEHDSRFAWTMRLAWCSLACHLSPVQSRASLTSMPRHPTLYLCSTSLKAGPRARAVLRALRHPTPASQAAAAKHHPLLA